MKTSHKIAQTFLTRTSRVLTTACIAFAFAFTLQSTNADIPDRPRATLNGMYKVSSSTDPIFPMRERQEWFLDFGEGTSRGVHSGTVAVSLRENPNVKVRIMVWQYFPEQGALLIGNQFGRGSSGAVAKGIWTISADAFRILLLRDNVSVTLRRADSSDY